ncbi:MAG: glycosyltransferase [Gemmatimonadaceae bacterium]
MADRLPEGPIRIIYCIDNMQLGGTELNAVRTVERLDRNRFAIEVVCMRATGPLMERYAAAGIAVHAFPMPSLWGTGAIRQGVRLMRLLRDRRIEVVHSHDAYTSVYATLWARMAGVRGVIASRRSWHSPHLRGQMLRANRLAYRFAHAVVGNSPSVARLVESEGGVPSARVVTIPNFLDPQAFDPIPTAERERLLTELGVPTRSFVVGIVARLAAVKDHATLFHAVASLRESIPEMHVVVVGDGPERESLGALATSLGIADIMHFAGQRAQAPNLHGLFDMSVLCSTSEAFPNSILEAMAASRAVVATDVGGNPDAIRQGGTGLLVPPSDPSRLAAAILRLYTEPALRAKLGAAARASAAAGYSADSVLPQLERLYQRMAGRVTA